MENAFRKLTEELNAAQQQRTSIPQAYPLANSIEELPELAQRQYARLCGKIDGLLTAIKLHQGEYVEVPA